jgi:hypothetical protein
LLNATIVAASMDHGALRRDPGENASGVDAFAGWLLPQAVAADGAARRCALSPSTVRVDEPEKPATRRSAEGARSIDQYS